ncbi:MAG TPA: FapA family protein [bacterium]|nr:FapA family protein [bacterium]
MPTAKDANGYLTIKTQSDGIFLTVFPPVGKGVKATLDDLKREIQKVNVTPDNPATLSAILQQASGKPQKIAEIKKVPGQENVFVEISDDEMQAKLTVVPPQSEKDHFTNIDDVRGALQRRGVVYGLDENKMAELSAKLSQFEGAKNINEPIEMDIALGTPVTNGEDARLEILYSQTPQEATPAAPEETEDGRVDYRAAHKIDNTAKGTLLARKIPPTKGLTGMTVTGKTLPAIDGKDVDVTMGKGVVVNPENKDEWIADNDGQVIIKDNKISVLAIYEVPGDVNLSTGNIDFVGTVTVRGDVKDGFKVFAGEDLIVNGVVEGAELKCNGKLSIAGGVSGNDKAKIVCGGDANIKYIRNAIVEVAGSLTSSQAIMHSKVTVGKKVNVSGQKGVIVGGQVIAGEHVHAASIGSNFATPTEIVVGEAVGLRDELQKMDIELKASLENLDKTKKGIQFLKDLQTKMGGNLPPEKKELLTKLTRAQFKLMADSKSMAEKKQELERKDQEGAEDRRRHAKVTCMGVIHTGVKITVNKASRQISEELKYCTLTESGGEVKVGPFKGN